MLVSIGIILYSALIFTAPIVKSWSWKYLNLQEILQCAFGYIFATALAHWPIEKVRDKAWETILAINKKKQDGDSRFYSRPYYACVVGIIERPLYIAAFQLGQPEFIALWMGAKIAGGWKGWENPKQGRDIFNAFMVGNALSLGYAVWGYQLIKWFYTDSYEVLIIAVSGVLVLSSWAIWGYFSVKGGKWLAKFNNELAQKK